MKFSKIPNDVLKERLEAENAMSCGKRYEVRTERNGEKVRAFAARKPYAKINDCNYFVWDLRDECKV